MFIMFPCAIFGTPVSFLYEVGFNVDCLQCFVGLPQWRNFTYYIIKPGLHIRHNPHLCHKEAVHTLAGMLIIVSMVLR